MPQPNHLANTRADENPDTRTNTTPWRYGLNNAQVQKQVQHHMGIKLSIKTALINIKGRTSGDVDNWLHIPQIIREERIGVSTVQEMHLTYKLANKFENLFGNNLLLKYSPDPTTCNTRGIVVVINKRLVNTQNVKEIEIIPGRVTIVKIPWHDNQHINVLVVYMLNTLREIAKFWKTIQDKVDTNPSLKPDVMMGDFNLMEDAINHIPSKLDDQTLGAEGVLPGGYIESLLRVFKQFTHT